MLGAYYTGQAYLGQSGFAGSAVVTQDALHAHSADGDLVLMQNQLLVVQDALHAHLVDLITLIASTLLIVQDALHAHLVDLITLLIKVKPKASGTVLPTSAYGDARSNRPAGFVNTATPESPGIFKTQPGGEVHGTKADYINVKP